MSNKKSKLPLSDNEAMMIKIKQLEETLGALIGASAMSGGGFPMGMGMGFGNVGAFGMGSANIMFMFDYIVRLKTLLIEKVNLEEKLNAEDVAILEDIVEKYSDK